MKLEKREITLNEQDSVKDVLMMEKNLLHAYANGLENVQRKETRNCLCLHLQDEAKEIFWVKDKLKSIHENSI